MTIYEIIACTSILVTSPIYLLIMNRLRGSGKIARTLACALMAIPLTIVVYFTLGWEKAAYAYAGTALTLWLCFLFGWGKFFPHGQNEVAGSKIYLEKEFLPAEWCANKIVGKWTKPEPYDFVVKWQTVAMSFRWFLTFGCLTFPTLGILFNSVVIGLLGILTLLAGPLYRLGFSKYSPDSVEKSEYYTGALLGALFSVIGVILMRGKNKNGEGDKQ